MLINTMTWQKISDLGQIDRKAPLCQTKKEKKKKEETQCDLNPRPFH